MRIIRAFVLLLVAVSFIGCYHVTVDTGRPPSGQTIEDPWANSFVYGLVPPETVETAMQCPNGVAKVESEISFLNGLVAFLTFQIYTPMTIVVQCAAGGSPDATVETSGAGAVLEEGAAAILNAAERSAEIGQPVLVRLR